MTTNPITTQQIRRAPCIPAEMPDVRLSLLSLWDSSSWHIWARNAIERTRVQSGEIDPVIHEKAYINWEKTALQTADLWWVGEEMCELLYAAAPNVPTETTLADVKMPSPSGLVVLERPWRGVDAMDPDNKMIVDAFVWGYSHLPPTPGYPNGTNCVSVSSYRLVDLDAAPDAAESSSVAAMLNDNVRRMLELDSGEVRLSPSGRYWYPLGRSDWAARRADQFPDRGR